MKINKTIETHHAILITVAVIVLAGLISFGVNRDAWAVIAYQLTSRGEKIQQLANGDQHLAPDDTGFIPPSVWTGNGRYEPVTQCEVWVQRQTMEYGRDLLSCHRARGAGINAEPACEDRALDAYKNRAHSRTGCPACLDIAHQDNAAAAVKAYLDSIYPIMYCDTNNTAAANRVSFGVSSVFYLMSGIHLERAIWELKTPDQEESKEQRTLNIYNAAIDKIKNFPDCLTTAAAKDLGRQTVDFFDRTSNMPFCQE